MASSLSRRAFGGENGKQVVKYTPCAKAEGIGDEEDDEELEEVTVVCGGEDNDDPDNACPAASIDLPGDLSSVTANGPRTIPGTPGTDDRTRLIGERLSSSGTKINVPSPIYSRTSSVRSSKTGKSNSRQSLLEMVSSKLHLNGDKKPRYSKEDVSYVNKAHVYSDSDITPQKRHLRRKEIHEKFEKWETSTQSNDHQGCNWTFVFDPSGRLCYYWSIFVSIAFLYNFWVLIYRFAFDEINMDTIYIWFSLDYFADFIYILDVGVGFRTGYLEDGVLQTDPVKLRQHYMNCTRFYIDCLCLLPLDFMYLSIGFNSMLRCFRLVKIYRFWAMLDRTERHTNYPNVFRAICLLHYLLVIFHWNASFYIIIKNLGWLEAKGSRGHFVDTDKLRLYLESFHWSTMTLTMIGDLPPPRTNGEYLFNIVETVFGLMMFAAVLGHVANIVTNISTARKEFQAKLDCVKTYMNLRRVPHHLQERVIRWFDYLWITKKSADEEKTLCYLPDKLKAEIAIHVHLNTLKQVEIFQNTEAGFLCELVLRLRPVLFSPGDYICRKGEVGKEMYIVNRGRLQVVADNGKNVLATLKAGSYFGEISILNMGTAGNRRTASVRSVGYSDLFCLAKNDLWDVLKEYPAARVRLEAVAVKRLENYKKAPISMAKMSRCSSTPALLESSGKNPIHKSFSPQAGTIKITSRNAQQHNDPSLLQTTDGNGNCSERKRPVSASPVAGSSRLCPSPQQYSNDSNIVCTNDCLSPENARPCSSVSADLLERLQEIKPGDPSSGILANVPQDAAGEILLQEIRRLRERLASLETDNTSMNLKVSQQQWEVEQRLSEIEMHICGSSSMGSVSSNVEEKNNRESVI